MVENGQSSGPSIPASSLHGPVRTCIGCRERVASSALLRVVARTGSSGSTLVVPDVRHSLPGRGAWIHEDPRCITSAEKRNAFVRALRVAKPIDTSDVHALIEKNT